VRGHGPVSRPEGFDPVDNLGGMPPRSGSQLASPDLPTPRIKGRADDPRVTVIDRSQYSHQAKKPGYGTGSQHRPSPSACCTSQGVIVRARRRMFLILVHAKSAEEEVPQRRRDAVLAAKPLNQSPLTPSPKAERSNKACGAARQLCVSAVFLPLRPLREPIPISSPATRKKKLPRLSETERL
jgi:hypothetical protein